VTSLLRSTSLPDPMMPTRSPTISRAATASHDLRASACSCSISSDGADREPVSAPRLAMLPSV